MVKINSNELAVESKKTCSDLASELYNTKGKDFCVGLIMHLTMHVSSSYDNKKKLGEKK